MMNTNTKAKLELFAHNNNWQLPHPLDMERFWEFVIEAYNNGDIGMNQESFYNVIEPIHQLNEGEISKWFIKYENGIELLRTYHKS